MNFINSLPPEVWEVLVSALFLSPFMAGIKKWFNIHREFVMTMYVIGGACVTAALAYIQSAPDFAPWLIIPLQGLVTFAVSQPVYYGIVKPMRRRIAEWNEQSDKIVEAKRSAAVPADGSLHG